MIRLATMSLAALLLSSCATGPEVSPAARSELAPTGRLRVGINVQNFLLVNKERAGGEYSGIAVDLGRELGKRLGVPVELVAFETAGNLADAVKAGAWDVAFLGNEPTRANEIAFSAAYLEIEAGYLVPAGSPIRTIAEVDREGLRVAVSAKSAYDLYLSRTLKRAQIVRAETSPGAIDLFFHEKLEAAAGVKQMLVRAAKENPAVRVVEGRFMAIEQAMGMPKGREGGARYLREFVEEMKASGFVAQSLDASGQRDAEIAPPAAAR